MRCSPRTAPARPGGYADTSRSLAAREDLYAQVRWRGGDGQGAGRPGDAAPRPAGLAREAVDPGRAHRHAEPAGGRLARPGRDGRAGRPARRRRPPRPANGLALYERKGNQVAAAAVRALLGLAARPWPATAARPAEPGRPDLPGRPGSAKIAGAVGSEEGGGHAALGPADGRLLNRLQLNASPAVAPERRLPRRRTPTAWSRSGGPSATWRRLAWDDPEFQVRLNDSPHAAREPDRGRCSGRPTSEAGDELVDPELVLTLTEALAAAVDPRYGTDS